MVTNNGILRVSTQFQIAPRAENKGIVTVDGGSIISAAAIEVGGASLATYTNATGILNLNSGSVYSSLALKVGTTGNIGVSGTVNVFGGTLEFNALTLGNGSSQGTLNLNGGMMTINGVGDSAVNINAANGAFNIGNGTVKWLGGNTHVGVIEARVAAGLISWSGTTTSMLYETWDFAATNAAGTSALYAYNDTTDPNNSTFVWSAAIPEPATIGLLGIGALAVLFTRRRMAR